MSRLVSTPLIAAPIVPLSQESEAQVPETNEDILQRKRKEALNQARNRIQCKALSIFLKHEKIREEWIILYLIIELGQAFRIFLEQNTEEYEIFYYPDSVAQGLYIILRSQIECAYQKVIQPNYQPPVSIDRWV